MKAILFMLFSTYFAFLRKLCFKRTEINYAKINPCLFN